MNKNKDKNTTHTPYIFSDGIGEDIDSDLYGLAYAQHIDKEWGLSGASNGRYSKEKREIRELQEYMEGNVDITYLAPVIGVNIEKSSIPLSWKALSIIPKYINAVTGGFPSDLQKITVKGIDGGSIEEKDAFKKNIHKKIVTKDFVKQMEQALGNSGSQGVEALAEEEMPKNEEELDIYMESEYKSDREAAVEIATRAMFDFNGYEEIDAQKNEDLVLFGLASIRHYYDNEMGIKFRRVNPNRLIYSFDEEDNMTKAGSFYAGEVLFKTIKQIRRETNKFTEEELKNMAKGAVSKHGNPSLMVDDDFNDFIVPVLDFTFKVSKEDNYKKTSKGLIKKKNDWRPSKDSNNERITNRYDVWYEGFYIIDTSYIYNYRMMDNMARPHSDLRKTIPPFLIYKTSSESIGSRIKPLAIQIFIIYMKLQQIIARLKPKGIAIDIDALQEITLNDGSLLSEIDQIRVYEEKGDLLYSGTALDGSLNKLPIHDIPNSSDDNIQKLILAYNHYRTLIEDATGINKFKDGSTPSSNSLVGVQKLSIAMSNNALKHIFRGSLNLTKRLAEACFVRLQDMSFDKKIYEGLRIAIGVENMDLIESFKNLSSFVAFTKIEIKPTEEERGEFRQMLSIALQTKEISINDVLELQNIDDLKYAYKRFKIIQKKRKEDALKEYQSREAYKSKLSIQTQNAIAQAKQKELMDKYTFEEKQANNDLKRELHKMKMKAYYDMRLKSIELQNRDVTVQKEHDIRKELEEFKEDRKDKRNDRHNTQASEMITQRQNKEKPKKFGEEELKENIF